MVVFNDEQNRKKIAEEAKREKGIFEARQKAQEKSRLQLRLGTLKSELEKFQRDLVSKTAQLQQEERSEDDIKRNIILEERNTKGHKEEIAKLEKEIEALSHGSVGAEPALSEKEKQIEVEERELERVTTELKRKIDKLEDELSRAQADLADKEAKLQKDKREVEEIKRKITSEHASGGRKQNEINSLKSRLARLTSGITSAISILRPKVKQTEAVEQKLELEISTLKTKISSLEREISSLSQTIGQIR